MGVDAFDSDMIGAVRHSRPGYRHVFAVILHCKTVSQCGAVGACSFEAVLHVVAVAVTVRVRLFGAVMPVYLDFATFSFQVPMLGLSWASIKTGALKGRAKTSVGGAYSGCVLASS
jgi:hypothetical protein